ncbi:hypothetical protein CAG58_00265 [Vibrio sp. V31_P5A7T61]|uniref:hypothetical protein n=1 Tax=unclassified Vibrio TaxID=2614977 RepID=UPI001372753D|nr:MULTISPECIES: hypothetical protein [unclassified Vibrio]EKO3893195.1 hypothetical protein [Vibrio metschnikovii]NAW60405.1 hypothetical protein [Vibrio sp. V31_P5A7T61]NAX64798.1 hypothetical protein [Vibrio sp. V32_P6A28T40]
MLKLKENCSRLNFKNIVKNDSTIEILMYGTGSQELYKSGIEELEECCISSPEYAEVFHQQIDSYKKILEDPNYIQGLYPRGIQKIIQQIIEPMSLWEAITSLTTDHFLASDNYFRNLVDVSLTFLLSSEIAKLFNHKPEDFSLYNIWLESKQKIQASNLVTLEEIEFIDSQFEVSGKKRDPRLKRLLNFRNKQVAHNSVADKTLKDDFIFVTCFILRVWAILDAVYRPNCMPSPIHMDEEIFYQFYKIMSNNELSYVKAKRLKFINELLSACSIDLITGANDGKRPFSELKITVNIT